MTLYGLTLGEISIVISIITSFGVIMVKFVTKLLSYIIDKETKDKFEELETKIETIEINQKEICNVKHCRLDDDMENKYATKEDLEKFSHDFSVLAQNIREDFHEVTKRIDNFILKFINKKD